MAETLKQIVVLPPIGIGRLGSATLRLSGLEMPDAMDNFRLMDDGSSARRAIAPAPTLRLAVDAQTNEISVVAEEIPGSVQFRGTENRIRPVAPFLEVWGRFNDDELIRPITKDDVDAATVQWSIEAGNRKAARRTQDPRDSVEAALQLWTEVGGSPVADHTLRPIEGQVAFFPDRPPVKFGHAVFLKPNDEFPEMRLRIYPAAGLIYGHQQSLPVDQNESLEIPAHRVVYEPGANPEAEWEKYNGRNDPFRTAPAGLERPGWFDDTCDGIVQVKIGQHVASARFACGPPDFVPQSHHVRSGLDEFEQMTLGPALPEQLPNNPEARKQHIETVIRIIRSALETVRNMNTNTLNETWSGSAFNSQRVNILRVVATHGFYLGMARQLADQDPERFTKAQAELERLGDQIRDFMLAPDFSPQLERKMPSMMRGSDGNNLCLTRRQRDTILRVRDLPQP